MNINKLWVTLYSPEQKVVHIEQLEDTIRLANQFLMAKRPEPFMVVGVFKKQCDALELCRKLGEMRERDEI